VLNTLTVILNRSPTKSGMWCRIARQAAVNDLFVLWL